MRARTKRGATRLTVLVFAIGLVAAACGTSTPTATGSSATGSSPATSPTETETEGSPSTIQVNGETANFEGEKDVSGETDVEVEADTDNGTSYFKPTVLTGTPGQQVTVELKNESDSVAHNFTIEDQNINQDLDPGKSATVTVTFPSSGVLEFHCEYHQSSGMVGELKVA